MTTRTAHDDLAYVRALAEAGATSPTLSGRFSLWWAALMTLALLVHWAAIVGHVGLKGGQIGLLWFATMAIGAIGSGAIGLTLRDKPGRAAPGNRAESVVWYVVIAAIVTYMTAITLGVSSGLLPPTLFATISAVAFLLLAVAASVSGVLFRSALPWWTTGVCLVTAFITLLLAGRAEAHLAAAAGVFLAFVIPGVIALRDEPKSVV